MKQEFPFYSFFIFFSLMMMSLRSYYTGYVDALGEKVSRLEEGVALRRARYILGGSFLLGCLLYLLNPEWMHWGQISYFPRSLRWVGVFLLITSLFFYRWIHIHLDKNFTDTVFIRKNAVLVATGPYRWIRHPMYVCGIMIAVGIGLVTANLFLGTVGLFLMGVIVFLRTPIEERKLIERFGKAYDDYRKETGRFFPKKLFKI